MPRFQTFLLTLLTMVAFASNSLLCRQALQHTDIDAATFTSIRIISGALALWLLVRTRDGNFRLAGDWPSAFALFVYAIAFSLAYVGLPAATGALLLFSAVQTTMICYGLWIGERLETRQIAGLTAAFGGLVALLLPGISAPPLGASILMLGAGAAWGIYSLRGRGCVDPTNVTAGNFVRAATAAALVGVLALPWSSLDSAGIFYAVLSGALASGMGYAAWYMALRSLTATSAATVQLSVPVIAAFGGVIFLDEIITQRLLIASVAILGGIAAVLIRAQPERTPGK